MRWPLCCLILASCTPRATLPINAPIEVKITSMPSRDVSCWMPDIPVPPAMKELNFDDDDIIRRTSVHYLDYNSMVQWTMEMVSWAEEVQKCVDNLRGIEP